MVLQRLVRPRHAVLRARAVRPAARLETPPLLPMAQSGTHARHGGLHRGAGGHDAPRRPRRHERDGPAQRRVLSAMVRPRLAAILPLLLLSGCVRSDFNLATQRQEYTLTSTDREVETGRKLARRVERELTLAADEPAQQRGRDIGARPAAVGDRRELVYTFAVIEETDVNAFSLPGGYVFINSGLVKEAGSDDELAAVIAHEVAH